MARLIRIAGGGPAGSAAALAALREGVEVELYEKANYPRHKVCGEFLSAEALPILESLGVSVALLKPARLRKLELNVGAIGRSGWLPEAAFGISRYALDAFLFSKVPAVRRETAVDADIIATGRAPASAARERLFGFKAHFSGPKSDAIALHFFSGAYVGVNAVEAGMTNVCGLAPEPLLRRFGFDFDALVASYSPLKRRLEPMSRAWKWIATPVAFGAGPPARDRYVAGDALRFIDPFTGSGMLNAIYTGRLAGIAAARGTPVADYTAECRRALSRPCAAAAMIRNALAAHLGALVIPMPLGLMYRLTRPTV